MVEHWKYQTQANSWSLVSSYCLPGADFSSVAYGDGGLYLVECVSKVILRGAWDGASPLASVVFSPLVFEAELSILGSAGSLEIYWLKGTGVPGVSGPGLFVVPSEQLQQPLYGSMVSDVGGQVSVASFCYRTHLPMTSPVVPDGGAVDGASTIKVAGSGSQSVEVVDDAGGVMGVGLAPPNGGEFEVPLSAPLQLGRVYGVREPGSVTSSPVRAERRLGFPETFSTSESLTGVQTLPDSYHVGNAGFGFYVDIEREPGVSPAKAFVGVIVIGYESDPIVPFDNGQGLNVVLISQYWFGALGFLGQNSQRGVVRWGLPIPNNPELAGIEMRAQFGMVDSDGGFRLSDAIGVLLLEQ